VSRIIDSGKRINSDRQREREISEFAIAKLNRKGRKQDHTKNNEEKKKRELKKSGAEIEVTSPWVSGRKQGKVKHLVG